MALVEFPDQKSYYGIGEVGRILGLSTSKIRFWEQEFPTLSPKKNQRGDRRFARKDVEQLALIQDLVERRGFTLAGARQFMRENGSKPQEETDVVASLKRLRSFLQELRDRL